MTCMEEIKLDLLFAAISTSEPSQLPFETDDEFGVRYDAWDTSVRQIYRHIELARPVVQELWARRPGADGLGRDLAEAQPRRHSGDNRR